MSSKNISPQRVSVHGGHSGQFCGHAKDALEDIVSAYIAKGFTWVGLTEHMPPDRVDHGYPEEAEAGLTAKDQWARFTDYFTTARRLQEKHAADITLSVGFETEAFEGYQPWLKRLIDEMKPDHIVGSIHHIRDILIDSTPESYGKAAALCGGIDALYCAYFDRQYELITTFSPAVVGHFDLIRIFDPDYRRRLDQPEIMQRIRRNLIAIKERDLILDFNVRALLKGQPEPYVARPVLEEAHKLGIAVIPGDDSHGIDNIGQYWDEALQILSDVGFDLNWKLPDQKQ